MAASASNSARVEPLFKDNYETWKMQVEALLTKNDLWEYVSGEKPIADEVTGDNTAAVALGVRRKAEWTNADKKAESDLILSIHPTELQHVQGCITSREVWLKLESIYASKGPARKATLLKQLMLQKLNEGDDVRNHMNRCVFDAVDRLAAMDVQVHKDLLSVMLLYSLPASYENFRCAIESQDELPPVDALKVKILKESDVRKQSSVIEMTGALAARGNGNRRRQGYGKNHEKNTTASTFKGNCYKCGKQGHKSPDCPTKKNGINTGKGKHNSKSTDDTFVAYYSRSRVSSNGEATIRPWILNSSCTAHLCGDKDSFKYLNASTYGKINLASQASNKIKGKGTVGLSVANGKDLRSVEFLDTLFVPELRSNLISVAKITNKDHDVLFKRDSAIVFDQQRQIKLTAERQEYWRRSNYIKPTLKGRSGRKSNVFNPIMVRNNAVKNLIRT